MTPLRVRGRINQSPNQSINSLSLSLALSLGLEGRDSVQVAPLVRARTPACHCGVFVHPPRDLPWRGSAVRASEVSGMSLPTKSQQDSPESTSDMVSFPRHPRACTEQDPHNSSKHLQQHIT